MPGASFDAEGRREPLPRPAASWWVPRPASKASGGFRHRGIATRLARIVAESRRSRRPNGSAPQDLADFPVQGVRREKLLQFARVPARSLPADVEATGSRVGQGSIAAFETARAREHGALLRVPCRTGAEPRRRPRPMRCETGSRPGAEFDVNWGEAALIVQKKFRACSI